MLGDKVGLLGLRLRLRRRRPRGRLALVVAAAAAALGLRRRVVMVEGVGDEQHGGVRATALHLLPRRAPLGAAATVVTPDARNRITEQAKLTKPN
uniref:Uncharacterized protein n=1 Tax=Arundo donax TaxID=35708 RepID=A0A0A9DIG0_ARUDO